MPRAILPIRNDDEERQGDHDRQELYNPNFGPLKSLGARIADKGYSGKVTITMVVQILLAIYYAVGYVLQLQNFYTYYTCEFRGIDIDYINESVRNTYYCPPVAQYEQREQFYFRTDVESFDCLGDREGRTLFRADKGPDPIVDSKDQALMKGEGSWKISLTFFLFVIFSFILFCGTRLYRGHYNQLIGFITFESKHHTPPKVAKFGLAFTTICNFSKGGGAVFMTEQCGKMSYRGGMMWSAFFDKDAQKLQGPVKATFNALYVLFFSLICLWLAVWGFQYIWYNKRDTFFTKKESFWLIRIVLVLTILSYYLIGVAQFNPEINFDFQYPNWAAISALSFADLVFSTIADLYFTRPCACLFAKCTTSDDDSAFSSKQDTAATGSTSMTSDVPESPSENPRENPSDRQGENPSDRPSYVPSDQRSNVGLDTLESRLEQGVNTLDPVANAGEKHVTYEDHCRTIEGKAYEKKIKHNVLAALQLNQINLGLDPYYIQGKRNDDALQELAKMLAESPEDEKEVLIALRAFQRSSVETNGGK